MFVVCCLFVCCSFVVYVLLFVVFLMFIFIYLFLLFVVFLQADLFGWQYLLIKRLVMRHSIEPVFEANPEQEETLTCLHEPGFGPRAHSELKLGCWADALAGNGSSHAKGVVKCLVAVYTSHQIGLSTRLL